MSAGVAFAPNRYSRVHLNTASLNYAPPKALVGATLKGYSLHCIIFRTATDVACGTGVLFLYYMERGVSSITGVDISEKMIEIASEKYGNHSEIELIADDVENISLSNTYDCCIVYNAFPHFVDPQLLIECLA